MEIAPLAIADPITEMPVCIAGPDQSRLPGVNSRMPNGWPPAIQSGTT